MEKIKLPTGERRELKKEILDLKFKGNEYKERGEYYDFLLGRADQAEGLIISELLGGNYSAEKNEEFASNRKKEKELFKSEWGKYANAAAAFGIEKAKKDLQEAQDKAEKEKVIYEILASLKKLKSECEYSSDLLEEGKSLMGASLESGFATYLVSQTFNEELFALKQFLHLIKELLEKKKAKK
jgi:hypothetical protein